jgi:uncharacterized protein YdeI (YjbR/CyaY-like superfamily)
MIGLDTTPLRGLRMDIGETLYVVSRDAWRGWLTDHHARKQEVWLIFCKKASGKPSISYDEAVEEAICYGWIDGQIKSMDRERFARRFTPRREESEWSNSNRERALKMLREGRMTKAGKVLLPDEILRS